MTTELIVFGVGAALEVVGLSVGAVGFHKTWQEFSTGDRRFLQPEIERLRRVPAWARRVLRRRRDVVVHPAAIESTVSSGVSSLHVTMGGLPSIAEDPEFFASEVQRRLRELHEESQRRPRESPLNPLRARLPLASLHTQLAERFSHAEGLSRSIAVGGLRQQVFGWLLIAVGFTVQAVATFMQT